MATSRSAKAFLQRSGTATTTACPRPRLSTGELRIHSIPLTKCQLNPALMTNVRGKPSPDRGKVDMWPPLQEATDE
jgi:hypothetical protein